MRWAVFVVFAYLCLGLETGFAPVMQLRAFGAICPSLLAPLAVFVSLFAPRPAALWACWILGLLLDLTNPYAQSAENLVFVIGPHALGFVFGGLLILQLRAMVFRRHTITVATLTLFFLAAASLVVVGVLVVRSWYGEEIFYYQTTALRELVHRLGIAVYSALLALPLGWLLLRTLPLWGFQMPHPGRRAW